MSPDEIKQLRTGIVRTALTFDNRARARVMTLGDCPTEDYRDAYFGSLMAGSYGWLLAAVLGMINRAEPWTGPEVAAWVQQCIDDGDFDDANADLDTADTP